MAVYAPQGLAAGKICLVRVSPEEFDKDGFRTWFNRRWTVSVRGLNLLRMSELESAKSGEIDVLLRSCAYKDGTGEGYRVSIGVNVKGKFVAISYESNDYAIFEKHQEELYGMFDSFDLDGAATTKGKIDDAVSPGNKPPVVSKPPEEKPAVQPPNKSELGKKRAPPKWQDDSAGSGRLDRLDQIAALLQDPKSNAPALLTEAARLCGFEIWTESRVKIAEPLGQPPLNLAISEIEIKDYSELFRAGHRVQVSDVVAGLDYALTDLGFKGTVRPHIDFWSGEAFASPNPSVRALASFMQALTASRRVGLDGQDAIQALFILRVATEEIAGPLRKSIRKDNPPELASIHPTPGYAEAPGWAGDAFTGGVTGLWDSILVLLDKGDSDVGKVNKKVGMLNAILSIVKFIATYVFLEGEIRIETPGQPLVRTKDLQAGDERTIVAKFFIDGTRVTDWMKDHRELVALAGLDLDMPKSGALSGVETFWMVDQSEFPSRQLIRTIKGGGGLDKVRTDKDGEARVTFEGAPQSVALDPKKVKPFEKKVRITVTPQVKATEMKQDLVDAVTSAIGIKGGGLAFATPLMEVLYRLKWECPVSIYLRVKDWSQAETIGQLTLDVKGNGRELGRDSLIVWTIDRRLEFSNVGMQVIGGEAPPVFTEAQLKMFPPLQRKQVEAGMKAAAEAAKTRTFFGMDPGTAKMSVKDSNHEWSAPVCGDDADVSDTAWAGSFEGEYSTKSSSPMMFRVVVDTVKKTASITAALHLKVKYSNTRQSDGEPPVITRRDSSIQILEDLILQKPFSQSDGFVIPVKETPVIGAAGTFDYYGTETIHFSWGPKNQFKGTALLSFSVTRKTTKPSRLSQEQRALHNMFRASSSDLVGANRATEVEVDSIETCFPVNLSPTASLKHAGTTGKPRAQGQMR